MDSDSWLGLVLLVVAIGLLTFVAAAESSILSASRGFARFLTGRGAPRTDLLRQYLRQRQLLISSFHHARVIAIAGGAAVSAYLIMGGLGRTWGAVVLAVFATILVASLLQATLHVVMTANPTKWSLILSPMVSLTSRVLGPVAATLELPARLALSTNASREDDETESLLELMALEGREGIIGSDQRQMIRGAINLAGTSVREIMVPRIDIVAIDVKSTLQDVVSTAIRHGYSRMPLYEESLDNIVGVIYAKDLLPYLQNGYKQVSLKDIARRPYFVPETKRASELLEDLRRSKVHMAIVVDEYGGTAGVVTIEDLLEEIVGEIQDEYDVGEVAAVEQVAENEAIVDARLSIDAFNRMFDLEITSKDFDTVGGFVYNQLGKMPAIGDEVRVNGLLVHVLSMAGRRIKKVHVVKEPAAQEQDGSDTGSPK